MASTVLVVEDSSSVRLVICHALQSKGYAVLPAENAQAALKLLDGRSIDLIISDLNMPGMNGLELLQRIKQIEHYRFVPSLMLTVESSMRHKELGRSVGAKAWMVKPFAPSNLLSAVSLLCKTAQPQPV